MYDSGEYLLNLETKDEIIKRLNALGGECSSALKKDDLILSYQRFIGEHAKDIWRRLDDTEKLVVSESIHGNFNRDQFIAKYKNEPVFYTRDGYYYQTPTLLGALFFGRERVMPGDVKQAFHPFAMKPKTYELPTSETLPNTVKQRCSEVVAIKELQAILQLIEKKPLKISEKTSMPSNATISLINEVLTGGDYYDGLAVEGDEIGSIRAVGWMFLLQAGKLIKKTGSSASVTAKGKKALKQPPEQVLKGLWESWVNTKLLDEFGRIHNIKGQASKGVKRHYTKPVERRDSIEMALTELPIGKWVEIENFLDFMLVNDFTFNILNAHVWDLYISDKQYGRLDVYSSTWEVLEAPYILCVLFEYAATLGIIDIGFESPVQKRMDLYDMWGAEFIPFISRYDGLSYIKITPLGAYILGLSDDYKMTLPDVKVAISKKGVVNVDAVIMPVSLKETLDVFLDPVGDNKWQVSEKCLVKALQSGHKIASLKAAFTTYNADVPPEVNVMLSVFDKSTKKIKLKDKLFLYECENSDLANKIIKTKKMSYVIRAGNNLVAVPEKSKDRFVSEMLKNNIIINT